MLKSIQQKLFLTVCAFSPALAGAALISPDQAKEVAAEFFQSGDLNRLGSPEAFVLSYTAVDDSSNPTCYVFNAKDGKGFVIVSADDSSQPVVGYSDSSVWDAAAMPGAARQMISSPIVMGQAASRRNVIARAAQTRKVLATPEWSQEAPFNNMIPNRRLTGCVGVALAEILKYHQYPAARPASLVKDGEATEYAWTSMRTDNHRTGYSAAEAEAVAALVADAAIGIGTDFGMSSSSAYEVKVPYALVSLFGYDSGVSYKKRSEMSKAAWDEVIVNEIDADRPVLYSGQDVSAGHAFVCDGYEMRGSVPYFHINWGWGGSANGYFASDALNPVVSKAHSYNDLMTIIYNIKPAQDATLWSDIHVTSDECQAGLNIDVEDIASAASFSLRAGALKNISNTDFSGKLAVALFDAAGNQKCLLNDGRNFSLIALQISKYVDFTCQVPSGVTVADGDKVRLVTMANGASAWLPVAGDLLAVGDADAKNYSIPYFQISLPANSGDVAVTADATKVIKGRDYTFTVTPMSTDKVITVKANGFILTPDASNRYKISNVLEDQQVSILVQNAADVLSKSTLWVTSGNLQNLLTEQEAATVKDLTLFGTINANDFTFMRDRMKLERLDISQVSITALGSNPANAIPTKAFMSYRSLKQVFLPKNLTTLKNACFGQTGLTSVEIPSGVGTWEYNVFANCTSLREVTVRRSAPAWINWCVFTNTPQAKLTVPIGASAAYMAKDYWKDFKEVVEENAVAPSTFSVAVAESKNIKFIPQTEGSEFASGASYVFTAEPDDSFGEANMEVYANSIRLYADANGNYTAKITANTLIHFESKQLEATTPDTAWKITGDGGGVGLVSDIVNVLPGKAFTVRVNAIKVPTGAEASKFYCMVLTDKDGNIKEFISPILTNMSTNSGNLTYNFGCQVNEATVKDGNLIRLATSYNKKNWQLVGSDAPGVSDRLSARGNQVTYHNVNMPQSINGARIEGAATQIVRGMPFTVKVTPNSPNDRVTLAVNGVNKAVSQAIANVTVPAVTEDLDITIQIHAAGASDFVVVNVKEGELASKLAECPDRLKLIGTIHVDDFSAFRSKAANIMDLDLSDVTIKGAAMTGNSIPENAFAPYSSSGSSALRSIVLPANLERIEQNAFARCLSIKEISIPASVVYVGPGAFAGCNSLTKIIMEGMTPPATGNLSPLPANTSGITLEVPRGTESAYSAAAFWSAISPQASKTIYWIKYDNTRAFIYNNAIYGDGSRIEFTPSSTNAVQVNLGLPSCPYKSKSDGIYRPGVIFKVYDNDTEITTSNSNFKAPDQYGTGGVYNVQFKPNLLNYPSYVNDPGYPQNHIIDVVFFYPIVFENLDGADGVTAEIKNTEGGEVYNAPLSAFTYGASGSKTVYREDKDYKFLLTPPSSEIELAVEVEHTIMLKPAKGNVEAQYETRRYEIYPDEQGLYTISSLPGDTKVYVSGKVVVEEGAALSADILAAVSKDNVEEFTELTITGEMDEEQFEAIREKFEAVETLDLSQIENEVIPANAFAGMESLNTVIIPETVTEIGAGAFAGCENIESITLPGVNSIGEGAFEGCTSLTSILIPSSDGTGAAAPAGAPRKITRSGSGISAESFRGLNPNCLIYIGENEIPESEALNIILNKGGNRVAASDITLDGNHAFNAPASFLLGDHKISFTAEVTASEACDVDGGWSTIILPFQPTKMTFGEEFAARKGSGLHLFSFDGEEAEVLTAQTELLPNHPYLANVSAPFASVPVTFTASAREQVDGEAVVYDVPFTPVPEETVAVGKEFSLYGSYDGQTRPVACYMLNEDGSKFIRPASGDENASVAPFSAYLVANEGITKDEMAVGEHPLWIHNPASTGAVGTKLHRSDKIGIASMTEKASVYYTVDGSDPTDAEGSRRLFTEPFAMEGIAMTVNAVAEYKGNVSDPVVLDFELKKVDLDYNLAQNWNWISQISENAIPVADFATEGIESLRSQTQEVVRDPNLGLVGTLKELAPAVGYKVSVNSESWSGKVTGVAYDPHVPIMLHKGWNWIGTPIDEGSLLIEDLLANLEAEEGDMLVGLDGFVQFDADSVWSGTVSHMVPGEGYMFFSNSEKELAYGIVAEHDVEAPAKAPVAAVDGLWTVDNHKYASVMPVIASLEGADAEDYVVAAFCGNECRGIGAVVNGFVMINVHGNDGDSINFRFMADDNEEMQSATTVRFEVKPTGTFSDPFAISLNGATAVETISLGEVGLAYEDGRFILRGDLSDVKSVEIYDLAGKTIARCAGATRTLNVGDIDGSVVTVVVHTGTGKFSRKIIVK